MTQTISNLRSLCNAKIIRELDVTCDYNRGNELVTYNKKIIYYHRSPKKYEKILLVKYGTQYVKFLHGCWTAKDVGSLSILLNV